uniref:Sulfotransferase domain-containing protein n=1 Tax=Haptolina ericina TaxID=156174 RepID=A0A7S3C3H0_9EUKA
MKQQGKKQEAVHRSMTRPDQPCICRGSFSKPYRGACLPTFMVIGSQKAATSKLRWYLSRHPEIEIPKEESFHKGPTAVAAWDTKADPTMLSGYLQNFNDVCNSSTISGLKMPDYIVMSELTIEHFHTENPAMRIIITLREPVARMYSYFSMQLRFGWSPINHMGKNPCMQKRLRALQQRKIAQGHTQHANKSIFTTEEIMVNNLHCVRPCYANNASGIGAEARQELWHNENVPECRNIYFTPLVHSMYALHLRRWRKAFSADSMLLLRFDDLVIRPLEVLQRLTKFLGISPYASNFKYEVGRENFTTIQRLLHSGAVTKKSLKMLQDFFAPHDEELHRMFPGQAFW